jgi:hypothetical protein
MLQCAADGFICLLILETENDNSFFSFWGADENGILAGTSYSENGKCTALRIHSNKLLKEEQFVAFALSVSNKIKIQQEQLIKNLAR